jgi:thiol-disulfide isomerase/thioredoxin
MKGSGVVLLTVLLAVTVAGGTQPEEKLPTTGDPAPALSIAHWAKGTEVKRFEKGKTYVVEFWATWCAPCLTSIPHLTALQKKYKGNGVVIVGVSDEDQDTVRPFLKERGDKMDYTVALDKEAATNAAYLGTANQRPLPHAFVVNGDGRILWHGHPMEGLDGVLEKVVAGKWDLEAAKKEEQQKADERKKIEGIGDTQDAYLALISGEGKPDPAKLKDLGEKLADAAKGHPKIAARVAWTLLTHPEIKHPDAALPLRMARDAAEATGGKDANILDTYARALHDSRKLAEAVQQQKKAVEQAPEGQVREAFRKTLEKYEGEAGERGGK